MHPGWRLCCLNRPFAAFHSRGTKPPCWDAKVALVQDKQRKLPFKIMSAFCWSYPSATFASQHGGFAPREWKAAKGLSMLNSRYVMISRVMSRIFLHRK